MTKANIAVIGGGLMGSGIAQTFASAGHSVAVHEPSEQVRGGILARVAADLELIGGDPDAVHRITITDDIGDAIRDADFITEAAPERLEVKRAIFAELTALVSPHAILASNSSVIPIGRIAQELESADRMVGTHWWNPAPLIPLVEVIQGPRTSEETVERTMVLLGSIGKTPAHVRKDVPGFVANRLQHALWREAIAMVADGICDARTLDLCVKNSFGLRLPVLGPLENADMIGLDLTLDIHHTIIPELDRTAGPNPFLMHHVAAGKLGFKSGEGFCSWTLDEMATLRAALVRHLAKTQRESDKT